MRVFCAILGLLPVGSAQENPRMVRIRTLRLTYILGSEAWEEYCSGLLSLIKDFVLSVWEEKKVRLYGSLILRMTLGI